MVHNGNRIKGIRIFLTADLIREWKSFMAGKDQCVCIDPGWSTRVFSLLTAKILRAATLEDLCTFACAKISHPYLPWHPKSQIFSIR